VLHRKDLREQSVGKEVKEPNGRILEEVERQPGGRPWERKHGSTVASLAFIL